MILGQAEDGPSWGEVAAGTIESAIGGIGTALSRAYQGVTGGGDVEAAAENDTPYIPEGPGDVTGVVGAGRARARKTTTEGGGGDYYSNGQGGASLWPWLLGVGLIAGGAYWFIKRKKHSKKGK